MKSIVFIAVLLAVFAPASVYSYECFVLANMSLYNLCPFSKIQTEDQVIFNHTVDGKNLTFRVGTERIHGCNLTNGTSFTWAKLADDNTCEEVASHAPTYSVLNISNSKEGFRMTFPKEARNTTAFTNATNQVIVNFKCNMNEVTTKHTPMNVTSQEDPITGDVTFTVDAESRFGCPAFPFEQLLEFLQQNQKYAAPALAIAGLVLTFFGLKFFHFALFTLAASAGTFICTVFLYQLTGVTVGNWGFWVIVVISTLLGIAAGYFALKLEKAAVFVVGCFFGTVGGNILFALFGTAMVSTGNTTPYYVTLVLTGLIGGGLSLLLFESVFILGTSLIGSYSIFYAISTYAGHFPPTISTIAGLTSFDAYGYAYLVLILLLSGVGAYVQFKTKGAKKTGTDEESGYGAPKQGYAPYRRQY